jgi:hypothetical protein
MSHEYYAHPYYAYVQPGWQMPAAPHTAEQGYPGVAPPSGSGAPVRMGDGGWHPGPQGGAMAYPYPPQQEASFFNFSNERFLKGLLVGAAVAYLLTNEHIQETAIKGVVKTWSMLQGGIEELKERFHDAEAEIRAAEAAGEE